MILLQEGLQYSLAVFVGFLYSSLAVPGLYYFLEYSRLAGKYSRVTSKRKNINKFEAALLGWRVGSEAGFENHREATRYDRAKPIVHGKTLVPPGGVLKSTPPTP